MTETATRRERMDQRDPQRPQYKPKSRYDLSWAGWNRSYLLMSNVEFMKELHGVLSRHIKDNEVSQGLFHFIKEIEGLLYPSDFPYVPEHY